MRGKVYITGAGCGDKDLITVKAVKALKECDTVIYDSLINEEILNFAPKNSEKIFAGKKMGCHYMKQEEINSLIIKKAKENKTVVRLKGGDPFVFGRGGEEAEALKAENIPYCLIPGITSAIGAAEYAGIPVTHRGVSRSFHVITGHTKEGKTAFSEDFGVLAHLEGTLVFLMGLNSIDEIANRLISEGKDPLTPSAVISKGTLPDEKCVKAPLKNIAEEAKKAELVSPAVIIVGGVTSLDMKSTFEMPLKGKKCVVTGTENFAEKQAKELESLGAEVIKIPHLETETIITAEEFKAEFDKYKNYTYIAFTSSNGIDIFFKLLFSCGDIRQISSFKFACIGTGTAERLKKYGIKADFVPSEYNAETMGKELNEILMEKDKVLSVGAKNHSLAFGEGIKKAQYNHLSIYDTKVNEYIIKENTEKYKNADFITFGSASGAEGWLKNAPVPQNAIPVCIGKPTSQVLSKKGIKTLIPHCADVKNMALAILNEVKTK